MDFSKESARKYINFKKTVGAVIFTVVFFMLFGSKDIMDWANRLKAGETRDRFIALIEPLNSLSEEYSLNVPRDWLRANFFYFSGIETDEAFGKEYIEIYDSASVAQMKKDSLDLEKEAGKEYSSDNPLKLLLIGDSMMGEGMGFMLEKNLSADSLFKVKRSFKYSSGLTRPDFYNWFDAAETLLSEDEYDAVIVSFGANDAQDLIVEKRNVRFTEEKWSEVYKSRVYNLLNLLTQNSIKVYWIELPIMREARFNSRMEKLNGIYEETISDFNKAVLFSINPYVCDSLNSFQMHRRINGKLTKLRNSDGIHLSNQGGDIAAKGLIQKIKEDFRLN